MTDDIAELFAHDAKRHAREREERRAAGIPEPTLHELAQGFGMHQPWNCPMGRGRCDECGAYWARERVLDETRDEERYDDERRAS